ncbi:family 16 glycoside hydrolase [Dyadobacter sp. OTU695]|uniref:family 16 glycoside hydrolase n=1 Tax=Dyadobacter sp. OTU695 TaxID=3043860 RepID=UPI00313E9A9A
MALPRLTPANDTVVVQQTTFGLDIIPRFVCNTWDEATSNPEGIDVVVIGSGMYGGYCASKIFEMSRERFGNGDPSKALRVLVLEAGPFVVAEHTQNVPNLGLFDPAGSGPIDVGSGTKPGTRNLVWGVGWRSNQPFVGQAYCVGGKGIYWGGWCPRLQESDLKDWPEEVRNYLLEVNKTNPVGTRPITHTDPLTKKTLSRSEPLSAYEAVEYEIGVAPGDDFVFDPVSITQENLEPVGLNEAVREFLTTQQATIDPRITQILPAPIAVQTQSFISGLFALDKYSSVPALTASARADHADGRSSDLRMCIVPLTHVIKLECASAGSESPEVGTRLVNRIVVNTNGERKTLNLGSHCQVVLAMSSIESTRLALESFSLESSLLKDPGQELMGRNLMIHVRSDIKFKVERKKLAEFVATRWAGKQLADVLQLAALHVQCEGEHGTYQYQLYAATNSFGPDSNMYKMVPDLQIQSKIADDFDNDSISLVLRSSGEVKGGRQSLIKDPTFDYIDLAGEADTDHEFGHRRAWVQFKTNPDHTADPIWQEMHDTAHSIAKALANGGSLTYDGDYTLPAFRTQQGVGTTFHEAGSLWMGDNPETSVTDANGHFHHVTNAYCADQALFTTVGSANPVLTGLCLARKVAEDIVTRHAGYSAPVSELIGFRAESLGLDRGWKTAPYNGIRFVGSDTIETKPDQGIGIYYLPEELEDFELSVEWKAFRTPAFPNSGVLLRMPDPSTVDFNDPAQFSAFYESAIEIQIDDLGKNFSKNRSPQSVFGDSKYKTGSIYGISPARQWASTVWAPDGEPTAGRYWNLYQISVIKNEVTVRLNGKLVSKATLEAPKRSSGFLGFQFHTGRVQFRKLHIKSIF